MCIEDKKCFAVLFCGLLLSCVLGVLQAGEPERWYLIPETELQSIEAYKTKSEQEKQSWQLQVQLLNREASILRKDSLSLNSQLSQARERARNLETLFNEYDAANLRLLSSKNGEIAILEQTNAEQSLRAVKAEEASIRRFIVIIALAGSWIVFIALKAYLFFRRKK